MLVAGEPPSDASVKATVTWVSPAVTSVTTGAAGAMGVISKVVADDVAASRAPLASTVAVIEQSPADTNVTAPVAESTVHTPAVEES